jgi:hypothetical protein
MLELEVAQPSAWRREWELREGGRVRATLRLPALRSGARVAVGSARWLVERQGGRFRPDYVLLDEAGRRELARLRRDGRRSLLEVGGRSAEWRKLAGKQGFGAVAEDGSVLATARLRTGWRTSGTVAVHDSVPEREVLAAAVLAAVLGIRKQEEQASAATAG